MSAHPVLTEAEDPGIEAVIADRIRSKILSGALSPGTKLREEAIAETFSVTRFRVRGVLQRLAFEELVDLQRNRGAFIASPSVKEAKDVFEARRVIERVTTEIATRTILTSQIAVLRRLLAAQERAVSAGERERAIRESGEFHRTLAGVAHNTALTAALDRLILRTSLIVALYGSPRATLQAATFHHRLLDVIERGESLVAARLMEQCLFAIEKELDFGSRETSDADVSRILSRIG